MSVKWHGQAAIIPQSAGHRTWCGLPSSTCVFGQHSNPRPNTVQPQGPRKTLPSTIWPKASKHVHEHKSLFPTFPPNHPRVTYSIHLNSPPVSRLFTVPLMASRGTVKPRASCREASWMAVLAGLIIYSEFRCKYEAHFGKVTWHTDVSSDF